MALRRLGVTKKELDRAPQISDMLARAYGRQTSEGDILPGNPKCAIDDSRLSSDPVAGKFLEVYDRIPKSDVDRISIEAICIKAQVSPQEFLGHVFLMRQSLAKAESSLVAINAFPSVVQKMVESASILGPNGVQDRRTLAQHPAIGFLPSPKGMIMNVNLFDSNAKPSEEEEEGDDDAIFNATFSGKTADLEEWADNRRTLLDDRKLLEGKK